MGRREAVHLDGHQAGEAVAIEPGRWRSQRSGCRCSRAARVRCIPRRATPDTATPAREVRAGVVPRGQVRSGGESGSVDPANVPADGAGGDPGDRDRPRGSSGSHWCRRRACELTAAAVDAAAHAAHRRGSSGDGRCGGTGHHGDRDLCFLARRHRGMSDRLRVLGFVPNLQSGWERRCCEMSARRAGSVVWALEPGRRVGLVTSELWPRDAESSNTPMVRAPWICQRCDDRAASNQDSGLFTEAWLIPRPCRRAHSAPTGPRGDACPVIRPSQQPTAHGSTQRRLACVGGVQRLGTFDRASARLGLAARSWDSSMLIGGPGARLPRASVTLTTPYPAVAVAPGSTRQLRDLGHDGHGTGRVDLVGRRRARPAGRQSCAAAASPSTGSSPTARDGDEGHAQRHRPGRRRPTATQRITSGARSPARRRRCRSTSGSPPNAAGEVSLTTDIAAAQGRLRRVLHVQPDAHQRHARGPPVQRHGQRAGRLDGRPPRSGRRHRPPASSSRPAAPRPVTVTAKAAADAAAGDLPDHGRRDERQRGRPTRTSRSRSPAATSSPSRPPTGAST